MAGNALPLRAVSALSVALYGMFLAIIIPPARKNKIVAVLIVISFALSFFGSYVPGIYPAPMHRILPEFIVDRLISGFLSVGKKLHGYLTNEAVVVGVESRTSSPIRIPRDKESLRHPDLVNLFPCGEGAGYAGGIVSAGIDGVNVAVAVSKYLTMEG